MTNIPDDIMAKARKARESIEQMKAVWPEGEKHNVDAETDRIIASVAADILSERTAQEAEIARLKTAISAWKDSARIKLHRAEVAETRVAELEKALKEAKPYVYAALHDINDYENYWARQEIKELLAAIDAALTPAKGEKNEKDKQRTLCKTNKEDC